MLPWSRGAGGPASSGGEEEGGSVRRNPERSRRAQGRSTAWASGRCPGGARGGARCQDTSRQHGALLDKSLAHRGSAAEKQSRPGAGVPPLRWPRGDAGRGGRGAGVWPDPLSLLDTLGPSPVLLSRQPVGQVRERRGRCLQWPRQRGRGGRGRWGEEGTGGRAQRPRRYLRRPRPRPRGAGSRAGPSRGAGSCPARPRCPRSAPRPAGWARRRGRSGRGRGRRARARSPAGGTPRGRCGGSSRRHTRCPTRPRATPPRGPRSGCARPPAAGPGLRARDGEERTPVHLRPESA